MLFPIAVIVVAGNVPVRIIRNVAALVAEHIPNAGKLSVLVPCTLNLEGSSRRPPYKIVFESHAAILAQIQEKG